jgi:creatinine amidohydrolase
MTSSERSPASNGGPLAALTAPEAQGGTTGDPSVLLVPLGATEQHGPHLPLGTDTTIASGWADAVSTQLADRGLRVAVAPALPYGSSGEHQSFDGTISIGQEALHHVLIELTRSATATFSHLVFLSGHAGNLGPLERATGQLAEEGHHTMHLVPAWPTGADRPPIDAHAGRTETSLMLHLAAELVRLDRAEPGTTESLESLMEPMMAGGVAAVSPNGILGDPTGAAAAEGRLLLDDLVARSCDTILAWVEAGGS